MWGRGGGGGRGECLFFNDTATTEIYTLSLHDALPISIPQATLRNQFANQVVSKIQRNGKYLLLQVPEGAMLLHLGMSGHVSLQTSMTPREKHTHAVFCFGSKTCLHFVDPRRFGCILWVPQSGKHPLLDKMGPDPFSPDANARSEEHTSELQSQA